MEHDTGGAGGGQLTHGATSGNTEGAAGCSGIQGIVGRSQAPTSMIDARNFLHTPTYLTEQAGAGSYIFCPLEYVNGSYLTSQSLVRSEVGID